MKVLNKALFTLFFTFLFFFIKFAPFLWGLSWLVPVPFSEHILVLPDGKLLFFFYFLHLEVFL